MKPFLIIFLQYNPFHLKTCMVVDAYAMVLVSLQLNLPSRWTARPTEFILQWMLRVTPNSKKIKCSTVNLEHQCYIFRRAYSTSKYYLSPVIRNIKYPENRTQKPWKKNFSLHLQAPTTFQNLRNASYNKTFSTTESLAPSGVLSVPEAFRPGKIKVHQGAIVGETNCYSCTTLNFVRMLYSSLNQTTVCTNFLLGTCHKLTM